MIANLLARLRYLRAWWDWLCDPSGDMRLDDELYAQSTRDLKAHDAWRKSYDAQVAARHPSPRDCTTFDCQTCLARNDPALVGRQSIEGDAILDIAAWLAVNGWADVPAGGRQQYAAYLRCARADYEAGVYSRV